MKVMGALDPDILTISQNKGALQEIKLIKERQRGKLKWGAFTDV